MYSVDHLIALFDIIEKLNLMKDNEEAKKHMQNTIDLINFINEKLKKKNHKS
jgi:flagellin-specific chaperone FliS